MFCPQCGGIKWEQLFGGNCGRSCVYCGKAMYCRPSYRSKVLILDSIPIKNPFKALWLRFVYNMKPGNRAKGKSNIEANKAYHKEMGDKARQMKRYLGR